MAGREIKLYYSVVPNRSIHYFLSSFPYSQESRSKETGFRISMRVFAESRYDKSGMTIGKRITDTITIVA